MRLNRAIDCSSGYSLIAKVTNINPTNCFATCKANKATMCEWSNHNVCWVQKCSAATYIVQTYWQSAIIPAACYEHPPTGTLGFTCDYPTATASGTATDQEGAPLSVSVYDGISGSGGTQIATGTANPNYSLPITAFTNGQIHQLYAYAKDIPTNVWYQIGSPFAASCAPTLDFSANPATVNQGDTSTLTWSSVNATSCTATPGDSSWSGSKTTSGTQATEPMLAPTIYTLTCSNAAGASISKDVTINVTKIAPTVLITDITQGDYCVQGPEGTVAWQYTSDAGIPQASWQMQIAADSAFNSIIYSGAGVAARPSLRTIAQRIISKFRNLIPFVHAATPVVTMHSAGTGQGILGFDTIYWARVKAWDQNSTESEWSAPVSFTTESGPWPQVSFTVEPEKPVAKQPAMFTDTTDYSGSSPVSRVWDFGDGTVVTESPGTGTIEHEYAEEATDIVARLTVTSAVSDPGSCSAIKSISADKPLPIYKEVRPGGVPSPSIAP